MNDCIRTVSLLTNFLSEAGVEFELKELETVTLNDFIAHNFTQLDERVLRLLVVRAMKDREQSLAKDVIDGDLLGHWGLIVDAIKSVTLHKRDSAVLNFQNLVTIGNNEGDIKGNCSIRHPHFVCCLIRLIIALD